MLLASFGGLSGQLIAFGITSELLNWHVLLGVSLAGSLIGIANLYVVAFFAAWVGCKIVSRAPSSELRDVLAIVVRIAAGAAWRVLSLVGHRQIADALTCSAIWILTDGRGVSDLCIFAAIFCDIRDQSISFPAIQYSQLCDEPHFADGGLSVRQQVQLRL